MLTTIAVPEVLNRATVSAFQSAVADAYADDGVSVVVLRGRPDVFCRGMDLAALDEDFSCKQDLSQFTGLLAELRTGTKPVVAVVEGAAAGGGVGICVAADLTIATSAASFALPELLFGLVPAMITPYLAERVRPAMLRRWALSAATLSASEAEAAGVVDVISDDPDRTLRKWSRLFQRVAPETVGLWKRHTLNWSASDPASVTAACLADPLVRGRIRSFVEEERLPWM